MALRVKVCGITNLQDALLAAELGADALGFVFHRPSPRYVSPEAAAEIIRQLPPFVWAVGVFVDAPRGEVAEVARRCGLHALQFHGQETPEYCRGWWPWRVIKALRVAGPEDLAAADRYRVDALLLDARVPGGPPGGTGRSFPWELARRVPGRVVLAGGLGPDNLERAVRLARPWGVDASSRLEAAPGRKDPELLRRFLQLARRL